MRFLRIKYQWTRELLEGPPMNEEDSIAPANEASLRDLVYPVSAGQAMRYLPTLEHFCVEFHFFKTVPEVFEVRGSANGESS